MSTIAELSLFPLDKGESLSPYVARVVKVIQDSGLSYHLGPMGTAIEGDWEDVMSTVHQCMDVMRSDSNRVYMVLTVDSRKEGEDRLNKKVESIRIKISNP